MFDAAVRLTAPELDAAPQRGTLARARHRALRRVAQTPSHDSVRLWALLDCASDERLFDWLSAEPQLPVPPLCLYDGQAAVRYSRYAPYLLLLPARGSPLVDRWLSEGWDRHWGIFLAARQLPATLKRHFKSLLNCGDKSGCRLLLRYYDPRVLPALLSASSPVNCQRFFGNSTIESFLVPQGSHLWRGRLGGNALALALGSGRLDEQTFDWMTEARASGLDLDSMKALSATTPDV